MYITKTIETWVGIFVFLAFLALLFLAIQVSGLSFQDGFLKSHFYPIRAQFDNVGNLKVRSAVRVGGVQVGRVASIVLNNQTYRADVVLDINNNVNTLPKDTSASITMAGLLGDNYVDLNPGFDSETLKPNDKLITTYSATNLLNLLSTFSGSKKKGE